MPTTLSAVCDSTGRGTGLYKRMITRWRSFDRQFFKRSLAESSVYVYRELQKPLLVEAIRRSTSLGHEKMSDERPLGFILHRAHGGTEMSAPASEASPASWGLAQEDAYKEFKLLDAYYRAGVYLIWGRPRSLNSSGRRLPVMG